MDHVALVSLQSRSFVSPPCYRYRLREINRELKYARARCPAVAKRSCQTFQKREKVRTITYADRQTDRQEHRHKCDLIRRPIFQKQIKQINNGLVCGIEFNSDQSIFILISRIWFGWSA